MPQPQYQHTVMQIVRMKGGVATLSLEAPLPRVSWGEAGVCRPTGKRSANRARPRTTAQARSRDRNADFFPCLRTIRRADF